MKKRRVKSGTTIKPKNKSSKPLVDFGSPKVPINKVKERPQHEKASDWQHAS